MVGLSIPAMRLSSVDFPLPDGPMMATASPASIRMLTSSIGGRGRTVVALGDVL